MPSKKKPRPLFELPAEVDSGGSAGWVYRSDRAPEGKTPEITGPTGPAQATAAARTNEAVKTAGTLALAFAVMTQAFALGAMIVIMPVAMSLRALGSLRDR